MKDWFVEHEASFSHIDSTPHSPDLNSIESLGCDREDFVQLSNSSIKDLALKKKQKQKKTASSYLNTTIMCVYN